MRAFIKNRPLETVAIALVVFGLAYGLLTGGW
jgi:hypothetical protein